MILDNRTTLANGEAIANGAASNIVGDVYDSGSEGINMADSYFVVTIPTAVAGGNTVEFELVASDTADLSSGVTPVLSSGALPVASLGAGAKPLSAKFPIGAVVGRYYGLRVTRVGAGTAGAVSAAFTPTVPANRAYAEGNN